VSQEKDEKLLMDTPLTGKVPRAHGPEPEPAPPTSDGYRYERPPVDSDVHRLLEGLRAPRFARSVRVPETDGQRAAHYEVGPRSVPPGVLTPPPQPSVMFSTTTEMPFKTWIDAAMPTMATTLTRAKRMRRVVIFGLVTSAAVALPVVLFLAGPRPRASEASAAVEAASVMAPPLPPPSAPSDTVAVTLQPPSEAEPAPVLSTPTVAAPTAAPAAHAAVEKPFPRALPTTRARATARPRAEASGASSPPPSGEIERDMGGL